MFKLEKEKIYYGLESGEQCINPHVCYNYFGENVYDSCRISSVNGYEIDYDTYLVENTVLSGKELLAIFKASKYSEFTVEEIIKILNKDYTYYMLDSLDFYMTRVYTVNRDMVNLVNNCQYDIECPFTIKEIEYWGKYSKYYNRLEKLSDSLDKKHGLTFEDLFRRKDKHTNLIMKLQRNLRKFYHFDE